MVRESEAKSAVEMGQERVLKCLTEGTLEEAKRENFECTICFQVMKKTTTVKECLHRFCHACIEQAMRVNNKECPLCKTHIPSRRSCTRDLAFDALIESIYGNPDEHRALETKESDDWWKKNKGSWKDIGESYVKQKEATKGRRATAPRAPRAQKRPKVAATSAVASAASGGKRGRGRPRKVVEAAAAPRASTPQEVMNFYLSVRNEEREDSERDARAEAAARRKAEEEKLEVLVTLTPGGDIPDLTMPKPYLLCKPNCKFSSLRRLIASKHPERLRAESIRLYALGAGETDASKSAAMVECSGDQLVRDYRGYRGASGALGEGVRIRYSLLSIGELRESSLYSH